MYYLLYVSYAVNPFSEADLKALLKQSVAHNKEAGITGMLIYCDQKFIQVLEGERKSVIELFSKIKTDPRHYKVSQLLSGPLNKRLFNNWAMGFKSLDKRSFSELSGYASPEAMFESDKIDNESHPALIFLKLFYEKNYRDFATIN